MSQSSGMLGFAVPAALPGQVRRRAGAGPLLVALALAAALAGVPALPGHPSVRVAGATAVAPDEPSALAAARAQGHPVEALADRTEFSQTFANPSGTLTLDETPVPVRVHRADGSWAAVDTTLRARPDGSAGPAAAVVDLSFSRGGTGPVVRVGRGGEELDLAWPSQLPPPTLSGDTATYPDVLPGVDLQLTAHALGFSDLLVVRTPAAARSPALASVRFAVAGVGLSLRSTPAGGLSAVDGNGHEAFAAPPASMWDAAGSRAAVEMRVAGGELDLVPDPRLLTGAGTRFPVFIDPNVDWVAGTGAQEAWTKVDACFPTQSYWNGANDPDTDRRGSVKVGRTPVESGDPCSGTLWRSYFRMDTSKVAGKLIGGATFNVYELWASSCAAKPADLYTSGAISSSTTWGSRPGSTFQLEKNFAHGYSSSCVPDWEGFNVADEVTNGARSGSGTLTLMLRAPDEGVCNANSTQDTCEWKRFDSGALSGSHTPYLSIQYDTPPNAPTNLYTDGSAYLYPNGRVPCDSGTHYINDATPTMHADVSDPDDTGSSQPQPLSGGYDWQWTTGSTTGSDAASSTGETPGNGQTVLATQHTVPSGELANGSSFAWRVRTDDTVTTSAYSPSGAYCNLVVDTSQVTQPPGFTSAGGTKVGAPVQVTLDPGGSTDVAGYLYGLNTSTPWKFVAASGSGLTATITVDPPVVGPNQLRAQIVGRGGNLGPVATLDITTTHAGGAVLLASYGMDQTSGSTILDSAGGHDATAAGSFTWIAGRTGASGDGALHLSATAPPGYAAAAEPVVDTRYGYTVSAWVRLDDTSAGYNVLSQDGVTVAPFYLVYRQSDNRWSFSATESDTVSPTADRAESDNAPVVGVWTHLVGVYCADPSCLAPGDTAPGRLYLYVDSGGGLQLQASQPVFGSPWMSTGGLQIGRGLSFAGTGYTSYLNGAVDDVTVYWADPCQTGATAPAPTCGIP